MDVVETTKPRVEKAMMTIHDGEVELLNSTNESLVEQNGAQMMVDEFGPPVLQKEIKSFLCTPQTDEVSQVVETASIGTSPQALLKSGVQVTEDKALPVLDPQEDEKPACNMRLEFDIFATKERESKTVQTASEETKFKGCSRIKREFSYSEEASVDVHSDESEVRDTTLSIVDHPLLQENSEEFAGITHGDQTDPTLAAKWTHEVSVDVFILAEWVEVEMHSVAEPEASTSDIASSFESEKFSRLDLVCVEPVFRNLTTEHEAPSPTGAVDFKKQESPQLWEKSMETIDHEMQVEELIPQSLGIQESITRIEREMASPDSIGTQSMHLPEKPLSGLVKQDSNHSNECETISQGLQVLPTEVDESPKNIVSTFTQDEDGSFRVYLSPTCGEAGESMAWDGIPIQVDRINVTEKTPCTSKNLVFADVEVKCDRILDADPYQSEKHVKNTIWRVPSFADRERVTEVDARTIDVTMVEKLESTSAPPKQPEGTAESREQVQRIWSLKHLKKRSLLVETRTVSEQSIRPLKSKAPKVVGLSWPPTPLIAAQDEYYVDTEDAPTSPRQGVAEFVGETDTIVAETNEVLLESESSPSEKPEGIDGAEATIQEEDLQGIWSLEYLKTRPMTVEPRTGIQKIPPLVKQKALKVVGLSWPPTPLTAAQDEYYVDTEDAPTSPRQGVAEFVGETDTIVAETNEVLLESESSPSEQPEGIDGAEATIQEEDLQGIWSLEYLKTRPVTVEPRTVIQKIPNSMKQKTPKVVGLSWPPTPLTMAPGIKGVLT